MDSNISPKFLVILIFKLIYLTSETRDKVAKMAQIDKRQTTEILCVMSKIWTYVNRSANNVSSI